MYGHGTLFLYQIEKRICTRIRWYCITILVDAGADENLASLPEIGKQR